ncbi:Protein of unknown function (DUF3102) [Desulfitobacterium sp. LBE]|nr:Protein of unknown function (DUF3102) [Desulfitobacterium sp. LBE]
MNAPTGQRTPLVIAAEINAINQESRRILLKNAIEVGRRLKEAKELLNHGEWMKWLKESVSYSKSTAENLMNLYDEYGPKLLPLSDDDPNSQTFGNLTYTQAVLLLGLPDEKREELVTQNDLGTMTTRQLTQAVKEQKTPVPPQIPKDIQIQYVSRTVSPQRESFTKTEPASAPAPSLVRTMKKNAPPAAKPSPMPSRSC